MKTLIFGGNTGWIGKMLMTLCDGITTKIPMQDFRHEDMSDLNPDRVIIAAGLTGRPNIDWCEDHKKQVIETNVMGTLNIARICHNLNIHVTYYGTGCIYEYDNDHQIGGLGFTEDDPPNFSGSYYSFTKSIVEKMLIEYDNVLILRIRMPISNDLHPRNFITKILSYPKIVNVPNSVSILDDLLPISIDMSNRKLTGIYNFVNPGPISHNEIMELYKKYVYNSHTWSNFSLEEQATILKAGRSNCTLDCKKLTDLYPLKSARQRIIEIFINIRDSQNY